MIGLEQIGIHAKLASQELALASSEKKVHALELIAKQLILDKEKIISANQKDLLAGKESGTTDALLDRLGFDAKRLQACAESIYDIIKLEDPIGEVIEDWQLYNGINTKKIRVPLGVIGIIFEARPNVAVDAAVLCLKTGNAVILKGSASALNSNICLVETMQMALEQAGLNPHCIQLIADPDRSSIDGLLKMNHYVDVIIPRGGAGLIQYVVQNSSVPVIETGAGNCHIFLDASADLQMSKDIILNAKVQRPSVCNAAETLLWHKDLPNDFILSIIKDLQSAGVKIRACADTKKIAQDTESATEEDWGLEYLDYILAVKQVASTNQAIMHINKYGTRHSESIITKSPEHAEHFMAAVDAAAIYWNASTRFTDGGEFGFGAEIGISTQKLHARGPMGLKELTSYKYLMYGAGQIRQ